MKDFLKWAGVFILLVFLSTLATLAVIKVVGHKILPQTFDSSVVTAQVSDNSTKVLTSLTDVFQLRQTMIDENRIDSTFLALPDGVLSNVVSVLLQRGGPVTKDEIVNEYIAGRSVYDNLPPNNTQAPTVQSDATTTTDPIANVSLEKVGSTTVTEAPQSGVGDKESPPSKDTVINGKRYKPVN
jgi:hypothetical protein